MLACDRLGRGGVLVWGGVVTCGVLGCGGLGWGGVLVWGGVLACGGLTCGGLGCGGLGWGGVLAWGGVLVCGGLRHSEWLAVHVGGVVALGQWRRLLGGSTSLGGRRLDRRGVQRARAGIG